MNSIDIQRGKVAFQPRARLLKLIGAELISDEVLAITELVKNAHDADASEVVISFQGVTGSDGEITVRDDGLGMDLDAVLGRWMQPAGSTKKGSAQRQTPSGRRMLGEKGVGRFAADKLGARLDLITRKRDDAREVHAVFDWDHFDDDARLLADVESGWEVRPAREILSSGTALRIRGLRAAWTERTFRRLCTRLARLRSPLQDRGEFRIRLESDEFPEYSGELRNDFLEKAPHRIEAWFDGEYTLRLALNGEAPTEHPWNGHGDLRCGPVHATVYAFDLETESLARIGPRNDVRGWLREWSGISVYRDGFRVWPYGEPHDDWLRLDQRRVNNPTVRLSNNQVVGFIELTRDGNPELLDQTNREGLINNAALEDLRRFMYHVLQTLEAERQSRRHPREPRKTGKDKTRRATAPVTEELDAFASRLEPDHAVELRRIAARVRAGVEQQAKRSQHLVAGFSELASAGQSSALVARLTAPLLDRLRVQCKTLRQGGVGAVAEELREIEDAVAALAARMALIDPHDVPAIERRRTIELLGEIETFTETAQPLLEQHGAVLKAVAADDGPHRVDMRPEVFQRILLTLTVNTLDWATARRPAKIRVRVERDDDACILLFSDNGPGIPAQNAERVFEPLFTTREGARGMGLAVVKSLIESHGGSVAVVIDGRRTGANIELRLPRKRARATLP